MSNDAPEEKTFNKNWLILALVGLVAAFLFQWQNSIDQGGIAQTDSGEIVRVKYENGNFKIFSNGKIPVAEALLCDETGRVLGKLSRESNETETFALRLNLPESELPRDRFLRVVVPALKSEGSPVVLVVENPFR